MNQNNIEITLDEVINCISKQIDKDITKEIIDIFKNNGYTYKIKVGYGNVYRIFCYFRKSKESIIINTIGKGFTPFSIQIRIENEETFHIFHELSRNILQQIISSKNCVKELCCNCGKEYIFSIDNKKYRKCCMLCDNFTISNFSSNDIESIIRIIKSEMILRNKVERKIIE